MTEEEKAKLAEAETKAKAEEEKARVEFEAGLEGFSDEEKAQKIAEKETNDREKHHEEELKRERERGDAAEKAAADAAFKLREKRRKEEEEGLDDEDKPLTAKELENILQRDRQITRKEIQSEIIFEKAKKLAGSEAEAQLIIEIHKNRTFPESLSLDEQLEEAYAIANRKSLMAKNEELKRALRSKDTISDNSVGTHRDSVPLDEPKMSSGDIQAIKAAGFAWDGKSRLYVKKLKSGRTLTYDPKTKTRKVI